LFSLIKKKRQLSVIAKIYPAAKEVFFMKNFELSKVAKALKMCIFAAKLNQKDS